MNESERQTDRVRRVIRFQHSKQNTWTTFKPGMRLSGYVPNHRCGYIWMDQENCLFVMHAVSTKVIYLFE